jgi:hypothetical protein
MNMKKAVVTDRFAGETPTERLARFYERKTPDERQRIRFALWGEIEREGGYLKISDRNESRVVALKKSEEREVFEHAMRRAAREAKEEKDASDALAKALGKDQPKQRGSVFKDMCLVA